MRVKKRIDFENTSNKQQSNSQTTTAMQGPVIYSSGNCENQPVDSLSANSSPIISKLASISPCDEYSLVEPTSDPIVDNSEHTMFALRLTFHDPIISPEITRQNLTVSTNQEIEEQQFDAIMRIYDKIEFHKNAVIYIFHDEIFINIIYSYLDFHNVFCAEAVLFFIQEYIQITSNEIQVINRLNENTFNNVILLLSESLEKSDSFQHINKISVTL